MDDVIQVLVFVVTMVVFIASAVMKQKKKSDGKSSNFEGIVESLFGIPPEMQQPTEVVHADSYFEEDVVLEAAPKVEKKFQEGTRAIRFENKNKEDAALVEEESDESFDARQAIIYSEIINRKYF